jgi:hypothetical protein
MDTYIDVQIQPFSLTPAQSPHPKNPMAQPSAEHVLSILEFGDFTPKGKFLWGSNFTFLVEVTHPDGDVLAVYKPTRGERPLWDFPSATLAGREVAAYIVSEALGWGFVPPTVYRANGPEGPGSLQLYIDHDAEYHYFNFSDDDRQRLRPVVLFDLLINNADRKGSHLLIDPEKKLWLIDHGICFHAEYKLRTVVWDFAGEMIPEQLCGAVARFLEDLSDNADVRQRLEKHLNPRELQALALRTERLRSTSHFPNPNPNFRPYPWPPV